MASLVELDALEVQVIVDNEVDPMSAYTNEGVQVSGRFLDIAMRSPHRASTGRPEDAKEMRMNSLCCGAHGLSVMITAIKGDRRHTVLFDTGPEEIVFDGNAKRLKVDLSPIELIHLSHWHRDHSGGMLRAIPLIKEAKARAGKPENLTVDLHPSRPEYRGFMGLEPISLEADPTFDEIQAAGAQVVKNDAAHTVLDDMFLISGEIPRVTSYELGLKRGIQFKNGAWIPDELIRDERFLMCNLKDKGLVVFTGCSHAGVINVSTHAMQLSPNTPLYAVLGGYHLAGLEDSQVLATVQDFKKLDPKLLLPGHCSGWRVKFEIEKEMPGRLAPSTVGTKFIF